MKEVVAGVIIGCFIITMLVIMEGHDCVVRTNKKITPDWELVVKGKTVDTVYVYKLENK